MVSLPATSLFIAGAPRCGTTTMTSYLRCHPKICFSYPKEPHFFTQLEDLDDVALAEARTRYLDQFFPHLSAEHLALAEGSVSTLYDPPTALRIIRAFPAARFVVMVRSPLQMLPSYHARLLFILDEDQEDFEVAWRLCEDRQAGRTLPRDCRDARLLDYRKIGALGQALQGLIAAVGRERCDVVVFDDLIADPDAAFRGILDFAGLPDPGPVSVARERQNAFCRSRWLQRVLMRPPEMLARTAMQKYKGPDWKNSPWKRLRSIIKRMNTVTRRAAPLSSDFRAELATAFAPDVARLSDLLQRDLGHWLAEAKDEI